MTTFPTDHLAPAGALSRPDTLRALASAPVRTAAEEARTLVAQGRLASLATLSANGAPWCSLVMYAALDDGTPVICLSTLAEHGRNVLADPRASLATAETGGDADDDPLDRGRVTLAGRLAAPQDPEAARGAYRAASPASSLYGDFGDFTYYTLHVERVRWVGGYGRMDSVTVADYHATAPDLTAGTAAYAIHHLNTDHADALLLVAQTLAGHPDATTARCVRADRYGLDLNVQTPHGTTATRVTFTEPVQAADGLRAATIELTRRARTPT